MPLMFQMLFNLFLLTTLTGEARSQRSVDPKGYIIFCPCMGRFGNQADHYLGALAFAKKLDRTLILPPWVEYVPGRSRSSQAPFASYFNESSVARFHRVVAAEKFFQELGDEVWPREKRFSLCYSGRYGSRQDDCNAKEGNPFGPFWDSLQVENCHRTDQTLLSNSGQMQSHLSGDSWLCLA